MTPDDHKIVQLAGDTAPVNDKYVGKMFEVTVDKSNWSLRLHDGVMPGGHEIFSIDSLMELFQARSLELDGLLNFKDQDRGLLARLGPATYRLRSLTVNSAQLKVGQADGYGGNPLIGLADDITADQVVSGNWSFSKQLIGTGGFKGNVEGNVVGNLTGDVLGNLTGDTTGNSTGAHVGSQKGDVDVRGATLLLDPGQIHLAAFNADVLTELSRLSAPLGTIAMFGGTIANIPAHWALCDGANGTPDLRDLFVIGSGLNYDVGDSGGSDKITGVFTLEPAGAHTHTLEIDGHALTVNEMPSHDHGSGVTDTDNTSFNHGTIPAVPAGSQGLNNHDAGTTEGLTTTVGGGAAHTHTGVSDSQGSHTHAIDATAVANLPPYFSLAYMMKVS